MSNYIPTTYSTRTEKFAAPRYHRIARCIRAAISFCFPHYQVRHAERIPHYACIFVANHALAAGPIAMCTRISRQLRPWVHWQVCFPQTFASYAMQDFWPNKPKRVLWWFWLLAHILSRLVPFVMCGMQAIPVYRDSRSITTFRKSMQTLNEELDIVLFPETDRPHGSYINDIDAGFIDIGKLRKRAGFPATFVPVYVCPALRTLSFGFPILYDNAATPEENRRVIAGKILSGITELAQEQPPHTPVTYRK